MAIYRGFYLQCNDAHYVEAHPFYLDCPTQNMIPYRDVEDAARGIDTLYDKQKRGVEHADE